MKKQKIFTLSNCLSFSRIFVIFPFFYLIKEKQNLILLLVTLLAMLTDFLDGYFARKLNQITELGKILDPVADKIAIGGGVIALYLYQDLPLWFLIVIVGRDVLILIGSLFILNKKSVVEPSNMPGKITVNIIAVAILFFILGQKQLFEFASILAAAGIIYSFILYFKVFIKSYFESGTK